MQVLRSLDELDARLADCDAAGKISDTELRRVFSTFRMDFSAEVPPDPFSDEYREVQLALYRRIAGRDYTPANERTKFDAAAADRRPFPYNSRNCRTVGFFTMGVGFLLHSLDLPEGSRVVEFGPGWGNSTLAMALTGLDVTAVDIEPDFCDLLRLRARRAEVGLNVVNADFLWAESVTEPFDAAIFFECFHHCSDHRRLVAALDRAVKPDGRIYFAAEPIVPDFPLPWGLRMDGESLWAIRANGWLELGFNDRYFIDMLARAGWSARKHVYPDLGWAAVWEARRGAAEPAPAPALTAAAPASPSDLSPELHAALAREAGLRAQIAALHASTSWRLTAPLRALARLRRR